MLHSLFMRDTLDPIGRRVRTLRLAHALTQQELADKAGLSRHAIMRIEADSRTAWPSTVRKIAAALGVHPIDITFGPKEKPRAAESVQHGAGAGKD
jgi:transcriptional regulator with XRE-family HTH domain